MPSKPHEIKTFAKFDFTISFGVVTESHSEYVRVFKDKDGLSITQEELQKMENPSTRGLTIDWEKTDKLIESRYVDWATRIDPDLESALPLPIEVWSTADGSILGTVLPDSGLRPDYRKLHDPCLILYDGKSKINLLPIFNVARILEIRKDAIKSIMAPNEILLALYPGFVLLNRQCAYQLKPNVPLQTSPELSNDGDLIEHH